MVVKLVCGMEFGVSLNGAEVGKVLGSEVPPGAASEVFTGVVHDSRRAVAGCVFVAVPGFKRDGVEFAAQALKRGASLVVAEKEVLGAPVLVVDDAREALARLACAFAGRPSEGMEVYGVTGTNGKTTTSYALFAILSEAFGEKRCGLMTTVETVFGGEREQAVRTTPEAPEVQGTLARMKRGGVKKVVMEVSSHGVALKRVSGMKFSGALFTNLSRDHLDLHGSMEEYYRAKRELLVRSEGPKLANSGDEWGRRLAGEVPGVSTFGAAKDADYRIEGVEADAGGTLFTLRHADGKLSLRTPLAGSYNVQNVAGAAAFALAVGVSGETTARAVGGMEQVPGRFERVPEASARGFEVVVDYAHTDVGLRAVLEVARNVAGASGGRVVCVFGAAGERDGAKRPLMGKVAAELADLSIITTDDAYGEDPAEIAREVAAGVASGVRAEIILDRREAIQHSLALAKRGDVVVVAGKGHERVQHLPQGDVPFHDASVVRELLRQTGEAR